METYMQLQFTMHTFSLGVGGILYINCIKFRQHFSLPASQVSQVLLCHPEKVGEAMSFKTELTVKSKAE